MVHRLWVQGMWHRPLQTHGEPSWLPVVRERVRLRARVAHWETAAGKGQRVVNSAARRDRVDLGARAFYATPIAGFDAEQGRGEPFFYYTQGAAAAEVRIDRFTGDLVVTRVDLLIDIGRSINPGVDRGQVIGGFVQGMGWVTGECLVYDEHGRLLSDSPTTYKIPAASDGPADFRCEFFPNDDNVENVARSKAVGEPPLMHAICVWSAVKHALSCVSPAAARRLCLPATNEEILRALHAPAGPAADGGGWGHSAETRSWGPAR